MSALMKYRQALSVLRAELTLLLAPAGLRVDAVQAEGDGWVLRVSEMGLSLEHANAAEASELKLPTKVDGENSRGISREVRHVAPLTRKGDEALMLMLGRASSHLSITGTGGKGGLSASAPDDAARLRWLAGTLVGDTVLAVRHVGGQEDGGAIMDELQRQLALFQRESRRVVGDDDPLPFLTAVDVWMPPAFPRGAAFLAQAKVVDA